MAVPLPVCLVRARDVLHLTQLELATLVGSSLRSVQRWENKLSIPSDWHLHRLADAVQSADPELAAVIELWAPRPPPPPPPPEPAPPASPPPEPAPPPPPVVAVARPPPPPPRIPDVVLVDSIVCAAAEAMALTPQTIRPAILAAFTRARDASITSDAVVAVLSPAAPPKDPRRRS